MNTADPRNKRRSAWWLLVCIAIGATVFNVLILLSSAFDLNETTYLFVGVPVISLLAAIAVFIVAVRRKRSPALPILLSFPVYWLISCLLFANAFAVRDHTRWFLNSKQLKAQVLALPDPANGELRHIEWGAWGFAGMETSEYLVFDPTDSLATATRSHSTDKLPGIPCKVPLLRRLERNWYAAQFYTNDAWGQCS